MSSRIISALVLCASLFAVTPQAYAGVILNEILFDPVGTDTGGEWIEIYNTGSEPADMSGWQMYPDQAGYFFFSEGFVLGPGSFVLVRLRSAGSRTAQELFHAGADANMGNTAGSVALFVPGKRGADTIRSFVQWGREKQTWESAASDAGIWERGTFLGVENRIDGSSIGVRMGEDGVSGVSVWALFSSPTQGAENSLPHPPPPEYPDGVPNQSPPQSSQSSESLSSHAPALPEPVKDVLLPIPPPPPPPPMPPVAAAPQPAPPASSVLLPVVSLPQAETAPGAVRLPPHAVPNKSPEKRVLGEEERVTEQRKNSSVESNEGGESASSSDSVRKPPRLLASASAPRISLVFFLGAVAAGIAAAAGFLAMRFFFWNDSG